MDDSAVRVGVIGCGGMGGRHARNLALEVPGARVSALMDTDAAKLREVADACGAPDVFSDPHALVASTDVDAVVIASPDATHAPLTLACADAGKPVLCEKPLALDAAEAERIVEAELTAGRRLVQVGFMREYDPAHLRLKAAVDAREIGALLSFRGVHNNISKGYARSVGEVIRNSAIHDVHSARWLMGREIEEVFVRRVAQTPGEPDTCRILVVLLSFAGGSTGVIQVNSDSGYGYEVDVELIGETGQVSTESLTAPAVRRSGALGRAIEQDWLERFATAYIDEARAWVSGAASGQLDGPSAWDGLQSLVVADACKRSFDTGQPVRVGGAAPPDLYARA